MNDRSTLKINPAQNMVSVEFWSLGLMTTITPLFFLFFFYSHNKI